MWLILLLCAATQHSALATSFPDWPERFADEDYPKPKFACKSEADCMFLGECSRDGTQCVCKEGFAGSRCHELDLLPTKLEYGFNNPNFPSWGGVVTRINDKYHMFASYMVNKCDLYSYGTNSAVLRATATKPEGPYAFQETVLGPFHHGAAITEDSANVYLFADGNRDLPAKYIHNCTARRDSKDMTPRRIVSPSVKSGDYAYGRAPHDYISITTLSKATANLKVTQANRVILQTNLEAGIMCNKTNAHPTVLKSGKTAMVLRGTYCDKFGKIPRCPAESFCQHQHLFFTTSVEGNPHEFEGEDKWTHIKQLSAAEDPFLWTDAQGRYHVLVHSKLACGGRGPREDRCILMGTSLDGKEWVAASRPAFEGQVQLSDGLKQLTLFQRPKILFAADGTTPLFLIGGVRRMPRAATQTLMIPFNVKENARFREVDIEHSNGEAEEEDEHDDVEEDGYAIGTAAPQQLDFKQLLSVIALGMLIAPVGFCFSYVCVRGATSLHGYTAVSQSEEV